LLWRAACAAPLSRCVAPGFTARLCDFCVPGTVWPFFARCAPACGSLAGTKPSQKRAAQTLACWTRAVTPADAPAGATGLQYQLCSRNGGIDAMQRCEQPFSAEHTGAAVLAQVSAHQYGALLALMVMLQQ
jgi:hypothetical protein